MVPLLKVVLLVLTVIFFIRAIWAYRNWKHEPSAALYSRKQKIKMGTLGFFAYFCDTLSLSSYALQTAAYRVGRLVDDRVLPGTLTAQCVAPSLVQALIFLTAVQVDPLTFWCLLIVGVVSGTWSASWVADLNRQTVRAILIPALLVVSATIFCGIQGWLPLGGEAIGLRGIPLLLGILGTAVLACLMGAGVGIYAPFMTLLYCLGMSPLSAFPVMTSMVCLISTSSAHLYLKKQAVDLQALIWTMISAPIGVVCAAHLLGKLDLKRLQWLLVLVLVYTAAGLYLDYKKESHKRSIRKA